MTPINQACLDFDQMLKATKGTKSHELYGLSDRPDYGYCAQLLDATSGDVYEMLDTTMVARALEAHDFVGLVTHGWASQITNGEEPLVPPSQDPNRKRVRLMVVVDKNHMFSAIRIDGDDELKTDEGMATGALADAIRRAVRRPLPPKEA